MTKPKSVGHPFGLAKPWPNNPRVNMYVCGLEMMKNVNAEMALMTNFCCCFSPLQPQPQSLNNPIFNIRLEKFYAHVVPPTVYV